MTIGLTLGGPALEAAERAVPHLVDERVASGITALDAGLWGPDAEPVAGSRLGWTQAVADARPLANRIELVRRELVERDLSHLVLSGVGGSSLAPQIIAATGGAELTVLDSTEPGQMRRALQQPLERTVLVVSSKSGTTIETDSHRRSYEQAFREAGIEPAERIVVVTDPGSPLDVLARDAGYRVFAADPTVGGRYAALTAFGLVPSGLAGADIDELIDEAEAAELELAIDVPSNPALILGAAIAAAQPRRGVLALVADGTHLVGFPDWVEQLVAASTGKLGTGILPVVLGPDAPELQSRADDLQVVRFIGDARDRRRQTQVAAGEILVSGSLGQLFLLWEYAVAVAGRLLGIDPFDQPDVESAKVATRARIERGEPADESVFSEPLPIDEDVTIRATPDVLHEPSDLGAALDALIGQLPEHGYLAVQAYVDRVGQPELVGIRDLLAERAGRPVTFGWGPRYLHSTGQFHKGGPATGVFLQVTSGVPIDLPIPGQPFTYGMLITAQADGDAAALADHGRPVLRVHLATPTAGDTLLRAAAAR